MLFEIAISILVVIILTWVSLFVLLNDFSVPTIDLSKYKTVLLIFPHPDDEVLTAGGLIKLLSDKGKKIILLTLTKGEKGNPQGGFDPNLKEIRSKEVNKVSKILHINKLILKDLGDGQLRINRNAVKEEITKAIENEKPDLVITYDLSGLYGHEDHIVVSEIVTSLIKDKLKNISLYYPTYPQHISSKIPLAINMAKDKSFISKRSNPNIKAFVGLNVIKKIQAVYAYKSQYRSFRRPIPKLIPLWFFHSMTLFEYFYKIN